MNNFFRALPQRFFEAPEGGSGGDGTPPAGPAAQTVETPSSVSVDYEKLAGVLDKRTSGKEDKVLQGYFKSQGLSPEEANQAMAAFKQQQIEKENQKNQEYQNTIKELEKLKAEKQETVVSDSFTKLANADNVPNEKLPFLLKMVERDGVVKEDGTVDELKAKAAYDAVLKAFPEFKVSTEGGSGFQQIGGAGGEGAGTGADAQLDAIFGIKK